MRIEQNVFFEGLDFQKCEFEYPFGKKECYKGKDGCYYRIDYFNHNYVIETAENEDDAKLNRFEDDDLYEDTMANEKLVETIRLALIKYVNLKE